MIKKILIKLIMALVLPVLLVSMATMVLTVSICDWLDAKEEE
jgi:hypothetical protein